jgi:hypothetical protein
MSNQLGSIYATTKSAKKYIMLDSENVEVSGNFFINGTNSRMPAEIENSLRDYLPLTYGISDPNPTTLYDQFADLSENVLKQRKDASFNNLDISGNVNINGGLTIYSDNASNRGGLLVNGDIANSGVVAGADPILTNIIRPAIPPINLHVPKNVLIGPSDTSNAQGRHPHGWETGLTPRLILNCKLGVGDPQRDLSVLAADGGTTLYSDAEINALPTPPSGQSDDTLLRYGQPGQMLVSQGYDLPPKWSNIAGVFANASISQNIFGAAVTNLNTWTSQVSQGITGTFTTPTAGWYQLNFSFQQRANGLGNVFSFCYLYILRSGTTIHTLLDDDNVSNGDTDVCRTKGGGFLVQMAANQSISFQSEANSGNYFVEGFASLVKVS